MEIPLIDFSELDGDKRSKTMATLHKACENWGFFQIENHGINKQLMEKVKNLVNQHYEENLKDNFYDSDIAKSSEKDNSKNIDWETAFFIRHHPDSNINELHNISQEFSKTVNDYIDQLIKLAEKLSMLMSENLGLDKNYIMKISAFLSELANRNRMHYFVVVCKCIYLPN